MRYYPSKIEKKWQARWLKERTYEPPLKAAKKPFYNLMMFPYPSAEGLHVGNMYHEVAVDIHGRFKRMQGFDVFEPIGLDGFGIHSENYALKIGKHPMTQARISEKNFYRQIGVIGNGFAWQKRLETYDPSYYRWTQWIFVQMFMRGLAYRKKQAVNWCPSCKTVLADEQVQGGVCERCGARVQEKELEQWFFKITNYAERLHRNLERLDWSEKIKIAQRNWIGRSEGAEIEFRIKNQESRIKIFTTRSDTLFGATYLVLAPDHEFIKNQESRIKNHAEVKKYIDKIKARSEEDRITQEREKTGIELKGITAINPATHEEIAIWVSDYVLGNVGTGAIMAVPAHDQRDFEFAKKFNLPVREVIEPLVINRHGPDAVRNGVPFKKRDAVVCIIKHWSEEKYLCLKWKKIDWRGFVVGGIEVGEDLISAGRREIEEETGYMSAKFIRGLGGVIHSQFYHVLKNENRWGRFTGLYFELQDGEQIAIADHEQKIHDVLWLTPEEVDAFINADDMRLLWARLHNEAGAYTADGILANSGEFSGMTSEEARIKIAATVRGKKKVHYRLRDWLISRQRYWGPPIPMIYCASCAKAKKGPRRDMPGWHAVSAGDLPVKLPFIKDFQPTGSGVSPLAAVEKFYKVRCPGCDSWARRETDVSDTFLDSAWYYFRYPDVHNKKEIFSHALAKKWLPVDFYMGGPEHAVMHLLYTRFMGMVFNDWGLTTSEEPIKKFRVHGLVLKDGSKMSKSKGNVVNPDEYIRAYGADALRMYLMFLGPLEQGGDFRDAGIKGITRFFERVWRLANEKRKTKNEKQQLKAQNPTLQRLLHKTIKKVTGDIENLQYNTAISALMILLNDLEANAADVWQEHVGVFLRLLAPFAPHIAEELWQELAKSEKRKAKNFKSIHLESWPKYNSKLLQEDTFELVVQVNGKVRDSFRAPLEITEEEVKHRALGREKIRTLLNYKKPVKIIYVPKRLVNIVLRGEDKGGSHGA